MFQICRLVYELMSSLDEEAIYKLQSLDEPYSFYNKVLLYSVANMSHTAVSSQELSFVIGDQIGITGQRQDGWSMGVMKNRSEIWGLFPSHKVKQQLEVVDYPTYDNIKLWTHQVLEGIRRILIQCYICVHVYNYDSQPVMYL